MSQSTLFAPNMDPVEVSRLCAHHLELVKSVQCIKSWQQGVSKPRHQRVVLQTTLHLASYELCLKLYEDFSMDALNALYMCCYWIQVMDCRTRNSFRVPKIPCGLTQRDLSRTTDPLGELRVKIDLYKNLALDLRGVMAAVHRFHEVVLEERFGK